MTMRQNNERHARIFFASARKTSTTRITSYGQKHYFVQIFSASHLLVRKFITLLVTSKGFKCDV